MAEVTIQLRDTPEGVVTVRSTFVPAIGARVTPAQALAMDLQSQAVRRAEVEAEHRAEIAARKAAKASLPLPPAAQADRGAGGGSKAKGSKGKGKKDPAAPAAPKTSEAEARTGIASAMQSAEAEAGADCGPEGADPAGGVAAGEPDAGASETVPGERNELVNEATK